MATGITIEKAKEYDRNIPSLASAGKEPLVRKYEDGVLVYIEKGDSFFVKYIDNHFHFVLDNGKYLKCSKAVDKQIFDACIKMCPRVRCHCSGTVLRSDILEE